MGNYFNPDNGSFRKDKNSTIYVDKTELLEFLNTQIGTNNCCISLSHARRFGKSHAAGMIDAYYSLGSESSSLFEGTKISTRPDYRKYMNKYNVIHIDVSTFWDSFKNDIVEKISEYIIDEIQSVFADKIDYKKMMSVVLLDAYKESKTQFIIILDEWDCVIRNSVDSEIIHKYLQFLHSLFKSEESKSFLALAYITGILPLKKIQDESALNNFREYTMLSSYPITEFFGFTEEEVQLLCEEYGLDFEAIKAWYNGYLIDGMHMYNPNSVSEVIQRHRYDSYWKNTSSYEAINSYITMDYDGLKSDVIKMLAGEKIRVNINNFRNDLKMISSKDEALTALIHLGYLGYDADKRSAFVPNYEVQSAFESALSTGTWSEVANAISRSDELLDATIDGDEKRVAEIIELAHETYTSVLTYNDENSLSCVLTLAYFTAPAYYNIVRELPAGKGFADFAFIPRANAGARPAMIVELKIDKSADSALEQIMEKRYAGVFRNCHQQVLLVGINYNKETKKHECKIKQIENRYSTDIYCHEES